MPSAVPESRNVKYLEKGFLAFALLGLVFIAFKGLRLEPDTVRDWLMARACLEDAECLRAGPPSSFWEVRQGGLWVLMLAAVQKPGLGLFPVFVVALIGKLAAAWLLMRCAASTIGRAAAFWAGVLFWVLLATADDVAVLWNPTFVPLVSVWFYWAFFRAFETRRMAFWLIAMLALAVGIQLHLILILLVPVWIAALLWRRTPRRSSLFPTLLCGLVILAAVTWLCSADALRLTWERADQLRRVGSGGSAGFSVIAGLLLVAVTALPVLRRREKRVGAWAWKGLALSASLPMAAILFAPLAFRYEPTWRHLLPFLPPFIVVAAWLLARLLKDRRLWMQAAVAGVLLIRVPFAQPEARICFDDIQVLAQELRQHGVHTYHDAFRRIRSPQWTDIMNGLQIYLPLNDADALDAPKSLDAPELMALINRDSEPPASLPADWSVFTSLHSWLLIVSRPEQVDLSRFDYAYTDSREIPSSGFRSVALRWNGIAEGRPRVMQDSDGRRYLHLRTQVRAPNKGRVRLHPFNKDAPAEIVAIDGVPVEKPTGGEQAWTLLPDASGATGEINWWMDVSRTGSPGKLPFILEIREGEDTLFDLAARVRGMF